jgi:Ser/Thr protein kinase RdoA (MazF antagonist)
MTLTRSKAGIGLEKIAIEAFSDELKHQILDDLGLAGKKMTLLDGFESFVFALDDKIIRITHHSHRLPDQIAAELEFIRHLADKGAAVCLPNTLPNGELLSSVDSFTACIFDRAKGSVLSRNDWTPSVIQEWGRCIGGFHQLSRSFRPVNKRIDWRQDENHNFAVRIPASQTKIIEMASQLLTDLEALPVNDDIYGLIHGDAHAGNFFLDDGKLTFFDFDDAIYTWFAYDIATILFGAVLGEHVEASRQAQEAEALRFLPLFLEGYAEVFPLDRFVITEMDRFLKLRELSLYAVIHAHLDVNNLTEWFPARFMKNREQRIVNGEPYLEVDFAKFQ